MKQSCHASSPLLRASAWIISLASLCVPLRAPCVEIPASEGARECVPLDPVAYVEAHPLRAVISPSEKTLVSDVRDIRFSNVHATALEFPLVSGRSGNPLKRFSFTDCTFRKVSDAELPGWERHGPAVWERVQKTTFEHVEGFTYTNTSFDAP